MAKSVFNTVYMINGHLVQLDEMLVKQAMANGESIPDPEPEPEPEPGSSLPPFTIRCKFSPGHIPTSGDSQVLVDDIHNVWDITKNSNSWDQIFNYNDSTALREVLDANTSGVINMNHLFYNCTNLSSVALFDTRSVYTMIGMFQGCKLLESIPKFDTRTVKDMSYMFASIDSLSCESLKTFPLLNTSAVTNMYRMFNDCTSLTSIPLLDTSSVTSMSQMFMRCTSLTSIPRLNTSKVTNMSSMFSGCTALTSIPLFDTSSVTDMRGMVSGCTSLTSIPVFNTKSVTNMMSMLQSCTSLTNIPLFDTSSVTNVSFMCMSCVNVEHGALALYQKLSSRITDYGKYRQAFQSCGANTTTGQAELAQIPEAWGGTSNV